MPQAEASPRMLRSTAGYYPDLSQRLILTIIALVGSLVSWG